MSSMVVANIFTNNIKTSLKLYPSTILGSGVVKQTIQHVDYLLFALILHKCTSHTKKKKETVYLK